MKLEIGKWEMGNWKLVFTSICINLFKASAMAISIISINSYISILLLVYLKRNINHSNHDTKNSEHISIGCVRINGRIFIRSDMGESR